MNTIPPNIYKTSPPKRAYLKNKTFFKKVGAKFKQDGAKFKKGLDL